MAQESWPKTERCRSNCPGGNPCTCNNYREKWRDQHTLHICKDPNCFCHSRERYEPKPQDWHEVHRLDDKTILSRYTGHVGWKPLGPKDETWEEYHDRLRAQGKEKIPDDVAPGWFDVDPETDYNLQELMEGEF